jgi:hypothetical protein
MTPARNARLTPVSSEADVRLGTVIARRMFFSPAKILWNGRTVDPAADSSDGTDFTADMPELRGTFDPCVSSWRQAPAHIPMPGMRKPRSAENRKSHGLAKGRAAAAEVGLLDKGMPCAKLTCAAACRNFSRAAIDDEVDPTTVGKRGFVRDRTSDVGVVEQELGDREARERPRSLELPVMSQTCVIANSSMNGAELG